MCMKQLHVRLYLGKQSYTFTMGKNDRQDRRLVVCQSKDTKLQPGMDRLQGKEGEMSQNDDKGGIGSTT